MISARQERALQLVKRVYDVFRPKFYNRITWVVVASGLTIASTNLIDWLVQITLGLAIDLQITDESDAVVGVGLVTLALLYNAFMVLVEHLGESTARESQRSDERSHDVDVFRRTDDLLNEKQFMQIVDWIASEHSSSPEQSARLDQYLYAFEGVGNSYLSGDLEDAKRKMVSSLDELREYMAIHFFNYGGRSCLDPDRNVDRGGLHATKQDYVRYHEQARELVERVGNAKGAYAGYRKAVRDALLV